LTGVLMLVCGTLVAIGLWADLAALLLAIFLVMAAFYAHAYWKETDPMTRAGQEAHFWKNIALAGACLFLLALFQQFHDGMSLTVGGSVF
jgi:putative oxidoreductase